MHKKILALCAALVALAALPAVASASPVLTDTSPPGTVVTVPVGAKIVATNTKNTVMTTSAGNIECTKSTMTGTVATNSGSLIEGNIETATFKGTESEERCSGPLGAVRVTVTSLPWCLKSTKTADQFELRGGKCSEASRAVTFTLDTALAGECSYSRSNVVGSFTTVTDEAAHLTASEVEFTKTAGGFACPSSGKLDMTYALETEDGTPVWIS